MKFEDRDISCSWDGQKISRGGTIYSLLHCIIYISKLIYVHVDLSTPPPHKRDIWAVFSRQAWLPFWYLYHHNFFLFLIPSLVSIMELLYALPSSSTKRPIQVEKYQIKHVPHWVLWFAAFDSDWISWMLLVGRKYGTKENFLYILLSRRGLEFTFTWQTWFCEIIITMIMIFF